MVNFQKQGRIKVDLQEGQVVTLVRISLRGERSQIVNLVRITLKGLSGPKMSKKRCTGIKRGQLHPHPALNPQLFRKRVK